MTQSTQPTQKKWGCYIAGGLGCFGLLFIGMIITVILLYFAFTQDDFSDATEINTPSGVNTPLRNDNSAGTKITIRSITTAEIEKILDEAGYDLSYQTSDYDGRITVSGSNADYTQYLSLVEEDDVVTTITIVTNKTDSASGPDVSLIETLLEYIEPSLLQEQWLNTVIVEANEQSEVDSFSRSVDRNGIFYYATVSHTDTTNSVAVSMIIDK